MKINKRYGILIDMQLELMRLRRKIDSRIESHPFRESEFDLSNPLVSEILKFGQEINIQSMRELEFKHYLISRYPKEGSWRTYWSETKKIAMYKGDLDILYARDKFQALFDSFSYSKKNGILPTDDIPHKANPCVTASFRRQCIKLYKEFIESLLNYTQSNPDEVPSDGVFWEGAVRKVLVNLYERDRDARTACIDHFGARCIVCDFDFESVYGHIGRGIIHVHHLRQISEIKESYLIDPVADLRPICPNCHVVIHKRTPPFTIDELKIMIQCRLVKPEGLQSQ